MSIQYAEQDRIPMQYLIIDVAQSPAFAHEKKYGGATVSCWIKNQTKKNARLIAKGWIEENGWVLNSIEDQYSVSAKTYRNKADGRQYFEQALIDDEVFVFITWPKAEKE